MVKIEAGKYYRTCDGEKVGPMIRHGSGWTTPEHGNAWYRDGTQPLDPNGSGPDAIISEWSSDFDPNWPHGHVTRDGRKARIVCTNARSQWPIVASVDHGDCEIVLRGGPDDFVNAPAPKRAWWVNVYGGTGRFADGYETRDGADAGAYPGRIACVHVTEGDGL